MKLTQFINKAIYLLTIALATTAGSLFVLQLFSKSLENSFEIAELIFTIIGIISIPYIFIVILRVQIFIDSFFRKRKFKPNARTLMALSSSLILSIPTYLFASTAYDNNGWNCEKGCIPDIHAFDFDYTFGTWFTFIVITASFILISRLKKI